MARKAAKRKARARKYIATRDIQWGQVFTLKAHQEFTEADLLPGMEAALRKWLRVGAAEVIEVSRLIIDMPMAERTLIIDMPMGELREAGKEPKSIEIAEQQGV